MIRDRAVSTNDASLPCNTRATAFVVRESAQLEPRSSTAHPEAAISVAGAGLEARLASALTCIKLLKPCLLFKKQYALKNNLKNFLISKSGRVLAGTHLGWGML